VFEPVENLPSRPENASDPLQELTRRDMGATCDADLLLMYDSLRVRQSNILVIREALDSDPENVPSELEKLIESRTDPGRNASQITASSLKGQLKGGREIEPFSCN
jgi:hypothetical protein